MDGQRLRNPRSESAEKNPEKMYAAITRIKRFIGFVVARRQNFYVLVDIAFRGDGSIWFRAAESAAGISRELCPYLRP